MTPSELVLNIAVQAFVIVGLNAALWMYAYVLYSKCLRDIDDIMLAAKRIAEENERLRARLAEKGGIDG